MSIGKHDVSSDGRASDEYLRACAPSVIIPAYSRPEALQRLLDSVAGANYPTGMPHVLISLDGGSSRETIGVANRFAAHHPTVEIVQQPKNLGLRRHVLLCGDQSERFGSIVLLEDDLVVDSWYYVFATAALSSFADDNSICGVALYAPEFSEFAEFPFAPLFSGASGYFMQVPCSWGQAWSATMWSEFRDWYECSSESSVSECQRLPSILRRWPESSWKKYFAAYMVSENKYFFYPYRSYTTNCSDSGGVHLTKTTSRFHVALSDPSRPDELYQFPSLTDDGAKYDAFMEREDIWKILAADIVPEGTIATDLYAIKPDQLLRGYDYCVSSREASRVICRFPLSFRPIEANLLFPESAVGKGGLVLARTEDLKTGGMTSQIKTWWALYRYFRKGVGLRDARRRIRQ